MSKQGFVFSAEAVLALVCLIALMASMGSMQRADLSQAVLYTQGCDFIDVVLRKEMLEDVNQMENILNQLGLEASLEDDTGKSYLHGSPSHYVVVTRTLVHQGTGGDISFRQLTLRIGK